MNWNTPSKPEDTGDALAGCLVMIVALIVCVVGWYAGYKFVMWVLS